MHLDCDSFESFLNHEQRHPGLNELLYPFYTIERTTHIIQNYEKNAAFRNKSTISLYYSSLLNQTPLILSLNQNPNRFNIG